MDIKHLLIAALALLLSAMAPAEAVTFGLHAHTFHFADDESTPPALRNRDSTPGIFVRVPEHKVLGAEPTAGIYRNSLGRTTVYGGLTWQTDDQRWAGSIALASGYRREVVIGARACPAGVTAPEGMWCWHEHGETGAILLPIGALSVAFPEARPYLAGGVPRVLWIGNGISLAIEWGAK